MRLSDEQIKHLQFLYGHAFKYASINQNLGETEAHDYAFWYVRQFPDGNVAHSAVEAFRTWESAKVTARQEGK